MKIIRGISARLCFTALAACALLVFAGTVAQATAPSGAIFTTLPDGSEVNYNIYAEKDDVYLDGGPGPGAPVGAAGLDAGIYVFQVTDPSGKILLSTDAAKCRRFNVSGDGVITSIVTTDPPCTTPHLTGEDMDHHLDYGAITVQLMPFADTPNRGGVYKVWVTKVENFGCDLGLVDCTARGTKHGFRPADSKTDNFKVKGTPLEIDSRFFNDQNGNGKKDSGEDWIDGLQIKWMDTLLASNIKSSYLNTSLDINHEAHVEAVENGVHQIVINDQAGCNVGAVYADGVRTAVDGPQIVQVPIRESFKKDTFFVDIACTPLQ